MKYPLYSFQCSERKQIQNCNCNTSVTLRTQRKVEEGLYLAEGVGGGVYACSQYLFKNEPYDLACPQKGES